MMIKQKTRNYSIDLLRIIAMYFVVVLHICNQSGIENSATGFSEQGVYCLYKTLTCVAVNVFAIISGYVGYNKTKLRVSKLLELWTTVVFYGIIIAIIMICSGAENAGYKDIIKAFLPVTLRQYWYFSAYVGLFFLMPLINKVVEILTVKQFIKTAIIALFVFSIYGIISIFFSDPFVLAGGYSLIWLVILYYIGAGFRHCNIKPKIPMRKYVWIVLIIWLANTSSFLITRYIASAIDNTLLSNAAEYLFTAYVSPAVVTLSLAIFFFFAKWNMRPLATNLLLTCSASAFSVYIIHTHPLLWNRQFRNIARLIGESSGIELLTYIPCLSAAIFLVCLIIDIVRAKLFGLLRISVVFQKIEQGLERVFEKLIYKCSLTIEETSQTNDTDIENSDHKMK